MKRINSLPVLLRNPKILLIGGGKVALQKANVLIEDQIEFSIISQIFCDDFTNLGIEKNHKVFEKADADNFNIIIDATGNSEVNNLLKELKRERFFLLNTVDVPEECDFYFSALLRYKNIKIAISSDGASPTLTQIVREKISDFLPDSLGELAENKLFERNNGIVDVERTREEANKIFGKVYLIGCGPGDPELLTIKAIRLLRNVDVVFYDNLITKEILNLVPSHVEKIYVGKSKGNHSASQDSINKLLLDYAEQGFRVARLKNGDPYIFGRGAEEAAFLINNNINVEIIAGISSAFAGPLSAGIPPTARGYSSGVTVVTAHSEGCGFNKNWIELLKIKKHTVIVLMGLTQVKNILDEAVKNDVDLSLPVAVISNATRVNQKTFITTLGKLEVTFIDFEKPAILVFGDVVNLSETLANASKAIHYPAE